MDSNLKVPAQLRALQQRLRSCRLCPAMIGPAVFGQPCDSRILLIGQAPGVFEGPRGRPFAHTAGKTLFKWLREATGNDEEELREMIYFSAVARCFPGKAPSGAGDRAPDRGEIENCSRHLRAEVEILKPDLILAVGRVAIAQVLSKTAHAKKPLAEVVGKKFVVEFHGHRATVVPLPHPSGVSRWPHSPEGKAKIKAALKLVTTEFARCAC